MTTDAIILETALDQPPELVWRALTEPALVARWLGVSDIRAIVGERFAVKPGGPAGEAPVDCEVLEADPNHLLSYRWRSEGAGEATVLDTVVTWILEPTAEGGTRLRLVHDGFPIVVRQPATTPARERAHARLTCANDNARSLKWAA